MLVYVQDKIVRRYHSEEIALVEHLRCYIYFLGFYKNKFRFFLNQNQGGKCIFPIGLQKGTFLQGEVCHLAARIDNNYPSFGRFRWRLKCRL